MVSFRLWLHCDCEYIFVNGMKDFFFNDLTCDVWYREYTESKLLILHHYNTENFPHKTDTLNHRKKWT